MALLESKVLEQFFDEIAPNYQFMNGLLSLHLDKYWRHRLLKECTLDSGEMILDVACGTGDILTMMRKKSSKSTLLGLDISHKMLHQARLNDSGLTLLRGNGIQTPFKNSTFDGITIAFGFRNMPDHREFLKESFRILKPGGKLLILELTQPENKIFRVLNQAYQRTLLPLISNLFARNKKAYEYLADSIDAFPHQIHIRKMMMEEGFNKSEYQLLNLGIVTLFCGIKLSE